MFIGRGRGFWKRYYKKSILVGLRYKSLKCFFIHSEKLRNDAISFAKSHIRNKYAWIIINRKLRKRIKKLSDKSSKKMLNIERFQDNINNIISKANKKTSLGFLSNYIKI